MKAKRKKTPTEKTRNAQGKSNTLILKFFRDIRPLEEIKGDKSEKKDSKIKEEKPEKQDLSYWIEKLFEYEIPQEEDLNDGVRTTRRRHQTKAPERRVRKIEFLDIEHIKNMLLQTEEGMTLYLNKWNARWGSPKIKDKIVTFFNFLIL